MVTRRRLASDASDARSPGHTAVHSSRVLTPAPGRSSRAATRALRTRRATPKRSRSTRPPPSTENQRASWPTRSTDAVRSDRGAASSSDEWRRSEASSVMRARVANVVPARPRRAGLAEASDTAGDFDGRSQEQARIAPDPSGDRGPPRARSRRWAAVSGVERRARAAQRAGPRLRAGSLESRPSRARAPALGAERRRRRWRRRSASPSRTATIAVWAPPRQ